MLLASAGKYWIYVAPKRRVNRLHSINRAYWLTLASMILENMVMESYFQRNEKYHS